jgi:hypothetical protein
VYSDHLPLVRASEPKPKEQRKTLNNLIQKLNELNVEIKHISGSGNIADPLSRSPVETPEQAPVAAAAAFHTAARKAHQDYKNNLISSVQQFAADLGAGNDVITLAQWSKLQDQDKVMASLKQYCIARTIPKSPEAFKIVQTFGQNLMVDPTNNVLYFSGRRRGAHNMPSNRIVVPSQSRNVVIASYHGPLNSGHFKPPVLCANILQRFWWPSLSIDCDLFVRACPACYKQQDRTTSKNRRPLQPLPPATYKGERVSADLCGPLPTTPAGNKYILTMCDHFTHYSVLIPIKDKSAHEVARNILEKYICVLGPFRVLFTDAGLEFSNQYLRQLPPRL